MEWQSCSTILPDPGRIFYKVSTERVGTDFVHPKKKQVEK
jgi:hypothetical protein